MQTKSEDGWNFKDIHIHIINIKSWLQGIHHHCSKRHMQGYLNEYHYRFQQTQLYGVNVRLAYEKDGHEFTKPFTLKHYEGMPKHLYL